MNRTSGTSVPASHFDAWPWLAGTLAPPAGSSWCRSRGKGGYWLAGEVEDRRRNAGSRLELAPA